MDLASYSERVRALSAKRDGEAIFNGSPEHAAIIVERIFSTARGRTRLLTGNLDAKVYGDPAVVQAATAFLAHAEHRFDVVVEDDGFSSSHPLWAAIGNNAQAHFHKAPVELSERIPYHFMTGDDDCFRFERDKNTHTAIAAFGDSGAGRNLNGIFDALVMKCSRLTKSIV